MDMNSNHRECCVCFKCRPTPRSRYTKQEWEPDIAVSDGYCRYCRKHRSYHANSHWHAGNVLAAGACDMGALIRNGVRSLRFEIGGDGISDRAAQAYSSEYVYNPI